MAWRRHILSVWILLEILSVPGARAAGIPQRPSKPASQAECLAWGKSYQAYWDTLIAAARARDERCKGKFKGAYTTVRGVCANTDGQVEFQSPCDEVTMWTKYEWIGYFHGIGACLRDLVHNQNAATKNASEEQVTLDEEDVAFLKSIAKQDRFIGDLAKASAGADWIANALGYVAKGPLELVVKWNQGLIGSWRRANQTMDGWNKKMTCDAISEHSFSTKALSYFQQLYEARGCDKFE